MSDQKNASDNGMRHQVWRHRGCSFCELPSYICNQCRAEVNEQGLERTIYGMERIIPNIRNSINQVPEQTTAKSLLGTLVPRDFIYV